MAFICLPGTVDLLAIQAANPLRYPYLLQTFGADGWDILFAFPQQQLIYPYASLLQEKSFFSDLENQWQDAQKTYKAEAGLSFPFRGGWFAYLGYELLHEIETRVPVRKSQNTFPLGAITRIPAAIVANKNLDKTYLFAESPDDAQYLAELEKDFRQSSLPEFQFNIEQLQEEADDIYLNSIKKALQYIRDGDLFQVNLSREWQARIVSQNAPFGLYASLRQHNPAAFGGLALFNEHAIISSSPERLIKVTGQDLETRPIAGTYPRSSDPAEDRALREALIRSPKERAEHIMLVDLERNDLGRIAKAGSVQVKELMRVETYAHVHHIESIVTAIKKESISPAEILRAVFPGGTITGCPKVRTMQVINELEASPRLAYTGSMGYINHDGDMDFNILIRSFMLSGDSLKFRAGGGIVADSDPQRELMETRAKAKGLLKSMGSSSC